MSALIILLRLIHILGAMFWLGGSITTAAFILPTARRTGPDGAPFMKSLMTESGFPLVFALAGWMTVLAGAILFVFVSGRFDHGWLASRQGIALSIGALFGIAAAIHGVVVLNVTARRLAAFTRAMETTGVPLRPEQVAEGQRLRERLGRGSVQNTGLLLVAGAAMAVARYL
ncbi:MAG: hypothetical protein ACHQ52_01530 [Candidatus Eisenbacteria bacterium]